MFGIFWAEYLTGGNLPEIYVAFLFVKKKSGKIKPMSQPKCECVVTLCNVEFFRLS